MDEQGPIQRDERGFLVGPCIIAKDEGPNTYATRIMGAGWSQGKMYPFGKPNPDVVDDLGWIPADAVRQAAARAELGILWI